MAVKADVRVSVEEKEASKKRFIAEKNRIITSLDRLQREVNNVRGWWKGAGGSAFMERFSRVKAEISANIESRVADYCTLMDATVESILETDRQLAQKVGLASVNTAPKTAAFGVTDFRLNPSLSKVNNGIFSPGPSNTHVRAAFEARADVQQVVWERTELGKSTITVTFNNGAPQKTLKEGEDYYINKSGNACFYNNVRTLLEASGATVNFIQHPVGSIIEVLQNGILISTLAEGTDYNIGADRKAHFLDMAYGPLPPGAVGTGAEALINSVAAEYFNSGEYLGFKIEIEDWFKQSTSINCSATAAAIVHQISGDKKYTLKYIDDYAWNGGITWSDAGLTYSNPASESKALEKVLQELKDGKMSVYKVNGSKNAHWVAICGYQICEDSTGTYDLRNFIIIDPADGQEKRLGDKYVTYNRVYNKETESWESTKTPIPAVCTTK